jgi:hypothetical protein
VPIISGGGGLPLTGGTLSGPLVVQTAIASPGSVKQLDILDTNQPDFEISTSAQDDGAGNVTAALNLSAALDGSAGLFLSEDNQNGLVELHTDSVSSLSRRTGSTGVGFRVGVGGVYAFKVLADAAVVVALHAAPADASLATGDCALWFDQTNGTAALNVKAKQADGTVKTATIPVIT